MKRILSFAPFVLVIAAVFAAAFFWLSSPEESVGQRCALNEGLYIVEVGKEHLELGDVHPPYNSNPPTSGWHTQTSAPWGVSEAPLADELQVHNLEHGGIVIQYKPGIDPTTLEKLTGLAKRYRSKVILAPRPSLDRNIALTAWTYLDKFDEFNECRIIGFIAAHINEGPEFMPD